MHNFDDEFIYEIYNFAAWLGTNIDDAVKNILTNTCTQKKYKGYCFYFNKYTKMIVQSPMRQL